MGENLRATEVMSLNDPDWVIKDRTGRTRMRKLHELIWLRRTAQLPDDLQFQDEAGTWQPVAELVEPIVREQDRVRSARTDERHGVVTHVQN